MSLCCKFKVRFTSNFTVVGCRGVHAVLLFNFVLDQPLAELPSATLNELEWSFRYVTGSAVVAEDEQFDPT